MPKVDLTPERESALKLIWGSKKIEEYKRAFVELSSDEATTMLALMKLGRMLENIPVSPEIKLLVTFAEETVLIALRLAKELGNVRNANKN